MQNKSSFSKLLELNLAILLISTSGVLGRYIDVPIGVIIGSRALIAAGLLYFFCRWKKLNLNLAKKDILAVGGSGLLLGLHWITYFYALKLSSVAIGMLSLFTYPIITAILEPIVFKTKILKFHIFLGLLVLVGIYFLVPDFSLENNTAKAVMVGTFSALCYTVRNIIMKPKVTKYNGSVLMFYQLLVMGAVLIPCFFTMQESSSFINYLPAILLLSIVTTAIGHTLFLYSLKHFSIATASIISCTQPIYGILIGILVLQEYPDYSTIIGGVIITATVVMESIRISRSKKKVKKTA